MPAYIITYGETRKDVRLRATARLIEAQACVEAIAGSQHAIADALTPAGGLIGPLPDQSMIGVLPKTWSALATDMGVELRYDPPIADGDWEHDAQEIELRKLCEVYNVHHGAWT
jgi:hypothetical protein